LDTLRKKFVLDVAMAGVLTHSGRISGLI